MIKGIYIKSKKIHYGLFQEEERKRTTNEEDTAV